MNTRQFDDFLNKEIEVEESIHKFNILDEDMEIPVHKVKDSDVVLKELCGKIKDAGFVARVWLPSTVGTMELHTGRINVCVGKDDSNGKYTITKIYVG